MGTPTIVCAPDSFKESLTALEVCHAVEQGMRQVWPEARFIHVPMADGGEGTVRSLVDATGGQIRTTTVDGPLGDPVDARWGLLGDGTTAVIEMAEASGLTLVPRERRDPLLTSTFGVGQLLIAALDEGVRHVVLGIGGSATNDGGAGMAQALGAQLIDTDGRELSRGGGALAQLSSLDLSGLDPRLPECTIEVACDVDNPLCGPRGASAVFGPQKGADQQRVAQLDAALAHWAQVVHETTGDDESGTPGAGAAGGLGFGLISLVGATLSSGVDIVLTHTGLADKIVGADLVVTGEGRMDSQTLSGKTPLGVLRAAQSVGVPVVAIAGCLGEGIEALHDAGFAAILPVVPGAIDLSEALANASDNVTRTAREAAALLELGGLGRWG